MKRKLDFRLILKALLFGIGASLAVGALLAAVGVNLKDASAIPPIAAVVCTAVCGIVCGIVCGTDRENGVLTSAVCSAALAVLVGTFSITGNSEYSTLFSRIGVPVAAIAFPLLSAYIFKAPSNVNRRIKKLRRI